MVLTNDNEDARRVVEQCYRRHKTVVNPIIEWTDADVWEFIRSEKIPYCELYDEGWRRLGCVGCPMAQQKGREKEFLRWPKYKYHYLKAFERMLEYRKRQNEEDPTRPVWRSGGQSIENPTAQDVYNWWMKYDTLPGQMNLFEDEMEDE